MPTAVNAYSGAASARPMVHLNQRVLTSCGHVEKLLLLQLCKLVWQCKSQPQALFMPATSALSEIQYSYLMSVYNSVLARLLEVFQVPVHLMEKDILHSSKVLQILRIACIMPACRADTISSEQSHALARHGSQCCWYPVLDLITHPGQHSVTRL